MGSTKRKAQKGIKEMAKKLWCDKGVTGEMLREFAATIPGPFVVTLKGSVAHMATPGTTLFGLTVRGSSKCRRKQARQLQAFLNGGSK